MIGQLLKEPFLSLEDAREKLSMQRESGKLSAFNLIIPRLWDNLLKLKYPLDTWIARDIIYNDCREFEEKLNGFQRLETLLGKTFIEGLYSELGTYTDVSHFANKLASLNAEQGCALRLVEGGATELRKCLQQKFKDICFSYDNRDFFVSVKHKRAELASQEEIEEALFGAMHEPQNDALRYYKRFDVLKTTNISHKFRNAVIEYIHCNLNKDLSAKSSQYDSVTKNYRFNDLDVKVSFDGLKNYISISQTESIIMLQFQESSDSKAVFSAAAYWDGVPLNQRLLALLSDQVSEYNNAVKCGFNSDIIQWIQIDLESQYETFVSSGNSFFSDWLNMYSFPIVLVLYFRFPFDTNINNWYLANSPAAQHSIVARLLR